MLKRIEFNLAATEKKIIKIVSLIILVSKINSKYLKKVLNDFNKSQSISKD